jgi:hypothetical protein
MIHESLLLDLIAVPFGFFVGFLLGWYSRNQQAKMEEKDRSERAEERRRLEKLETKKRDLAGMVRDTLGKEFRGDETIVVANLTSESCVTVFRNKTHSEFNWGATVHLFDNRIVLTRSSVPSTHMDDKIYTLDLNGASKACRDTVAFIRSQQ